MMDGLKFLDLMMIGNARSLFLAGHGAWGYVLAMVAARLLGVKSNPYLAILLAMLPDADILLYELGIRHRSVTHSIIFWVILFTPFFIMYRRRSIPYFLAAVQHIMLGDIIVGSTKVLWPLGYELGLRLPLTSSISIAVEFVGLAIMIALTLKYGIDRRDSALLLSIVTLIPILGSLAYLFDIITVAPKRLSIVENTQYVILLHSIFLALLLLPSIHYMKRFVRLRA